MFHELKFRTICYAPSHQQHMCCCFFLLFASFVQSPLNKFLVYMFLEYDIMIFNVYGLKFSQLIFSLSVLLFLFSVALVVVADVVVVITNNNNNNHDLRLFLVNFAHSNGTFTFSFSDRRCSIQYIHTYITCWTQYTLYS